MEDKTLFDRFDREGRLRIPGVETAFEDLPWTKHPSFEGVELKAIVSGKETGGKFSYHLVRIAPHRMIGEHVHQTQLETHEVIAGSGLCVNGGEELVYEPGVVTILPRNVPHAVTAGDGGLYLFAKFIPALN